MHIMCLDPIDPTLLPVMSLLYFPTITFPSQLHVSSFFVNIRQAYSKMCTQNYKLYITFLKPL